MFWRDLVAFTWSIETMDGRDAVCAMLSDHRALQIKARLEGIATQVHKPQPFTRPPLRAM
jgi:hypothetical protein